MTGTNFYYSNATFYIVLPFKRRDMKYAEFEQRGTIF